MMKVVSLFSGAGGLDLGFKNAGFQIVWANDIDSDAVQTYKKNIGDHIVLKDLSQVDMNDIPNCDVVIGGFPCQGFSQANLLRNKDDERNQLYLEFLRVVDAKKPKFFFAENVRGILSLDNGTAIEKIESDFKALGYKVKKQLFNVADYGVPQMRYRVIIVGVRNDINIEYMYPLPTHTSPKKVNKMGLAPWVNIGDALNGIPEPDSNCDLLNHVYSAYKITNRNFTGHRETDPNKPSPTILARGNGKGGVCAIQHPKNHRRMSVRESATIQTFPLDYEFVGSMTSCYRQVGNAVPVLFAESLAKSLKNIIVGDNK
ncbi:DNA cytosine methyltransferase [Citrobacter koseri]|uniref:DNA cytosine methyltransferase n=1 Tax=Citrobacter koseri TaxID=545 RepID=UPI0023B2653C|nr:DNA cytosine methyltransferase [Citrobacter koseri]MDE9580489.1 DNA cytosine methyltransferase [Citrobacter koseri]